MKFQCASCRKVFDASHLSDASLDCAEADSVAVALGRLDPEDMLCIPCGDDEDIEVAEAIAPTWQLPSSLVFHLSGGREMSQAERTFLALNY